jgi:hypothetical protein
MRKRQRHVNPRHAGAVLVLDARYIAQADNTAVSTWTDRSGNGYNFAQATGANQPTLQVGELGGSSVVRFDGSNDYLSRSDTGFPTGNITFLCVSKQNNVMATGQYRCVLHYGAASIGSALFFTYGEDANFVSDAFGVSTYGVGGGISNSTGSYYVMSATRSGTTVSMWRNGSSLVTQTMQSNTATYGANGATVGSFNASLSYGSYLNGDVGIISHANSEWPNALRKRFQFALGYTWKIACS